MMYRLTRDLHLYAGLLISPFVLVFAVSVFFLNHGKISITPTTVETFRDLRVPGDLERLQGRAAVDRARSVLPQVGVTGEIGFLRVLQKERRVVFPVSRPGLEATVDVDLAARTALVSSRRTGIQEAFAYLHKSPGPHNVALRGNWWLTGVWRVFADATVYLLLFVSLSGVYLWFVLKAERTVGIALIAAGALSLSGLIYAVIR